MNRLLLSGPAPNSWLSTVEKLFGIMLVVLCRIAQASAAASDTPGHISSKPFFEASKSVIAAYNHADSAGLKRLLGDENGSQLAAARPQTGPMVIVRKPSDSAQSALDFLVRVRGGHVARLTFLESRRNPGTIGDIFVIPQADMSRVTPLPTHKVSRSQAIKSLDAFLSGLARQDFFSGVVRISDSKGVFFERAYGQANRSTRSPNTISTKFHLASVGKMFTAVAIAQLIEKGKLRMDESLAEALPDYPNPTNAAKITIAHLVSHRSGLGDIFKPEYLKTHPGAYVRPYDYYPIFAGDRLRFEPGSRFGYSNAGYIVLAAIIEHVTGESFESYLRKNVFAPAGIADVDFTGSEGSDATHTYMFADEDPFGLKPRIDSSSFFAALGDLRCDAPGGERMSAASLDSFFRALRAGKLVSTSILDTLLPPISLHIDGTPDRDYGYGFESIEIGEVKVPGHSGGGGGIDNQTGMLPKNDLNVIMLANVDPTGGDIYRSICKFLLQQKAP